MYSGPKLQIFYPSAKSLENSSSILQLHPFIGLSIHQSNSRAIHASSCQSISQSINPIIVLSVSQFIHLSFHPSVCQPVRSSIHPSASWSLHPYICQWISQSIHPSFYLSADQSIRPSIRLSTNQSCLVHPSIFLLNRWLSCLLNWGFSEVIRGH